MIVVLAVVAVALYFDPAAGGHDESERSILAEKKRGCVGDWISRGLYCHWVDKEGNRVSSRAY